jgi:hypothetical protein
MVIKFGDFSFEFEIPNLLFPKIYTDHKKMVKIILKTLKHPLFDDKKIYYYMSFVPNALQFLDPESFRSIEEYLIGKRKYNNIDVKIVCFQESDWCEGIKANVYDRLSDNQKKKGAWKRYLEHSIHFVEKLMEYYGEDVIKVIPKPIPYHIAITERNGYIALVEPDLFRNTFPETADKINILGIKINHKDYKMNIITKSFFEYHNVIGKTLDLEKLKRGFKDLASI